MKTQIIAVLIASLFIVGAVALADDSDAASTYEIKYSVDSTEYTFKGIEPSVGLKSLADLGITLDEGKIMKGWTNSSQLFGVGSTVNLTDGTPTEFVADIDDIEYTVTIIVDGENLRTPERVTYNNSIEAVEDQEPKEGFTFGGWSDGVKTYTTAELNALKIKADVTFTAVFNEIYNIDWIVDGVKVAEGKSNAIGIPIEPVKECHRFLGWTVDGVLMIKEGDNTFPKDFEFVGDVEMVASFEADTYTVKIAYPDGTVWQSQTVKHGDLAVMPSGIPEGYLLDYKAFTVAIVEDTVITLAVEPEEIMFYDTPMGQCAIVIAVFLGGLLAWALATGKITIPKKGGKKA